MTPVRTEHDLRVALLRLAERDVPRVEAVLPHDVPAGRGTSRWALVAAVVIGVLAVAFVTILSERSAHSRRGPAASERALTARGWQLVRAGDQDVRGVVGLRIRENGAFYQGTGECFGIIGHLVVHGSSLSVRRHRTLAGSCPATTRPDVLDPSDAVIRHVTTFFDGRIGWRVRGNRLTLTRIGEPSLTYVRAAWISGGSRTFVYSGVGIVVPSTWRRNAQRCGTPTANTVLYPGGVLDCLVANPARVSSVQFEPLGTTEPGTVDPTGRARNIDVNGVPAVEVRGTATVGARKISMHAIRVTIPSRHTSVVITSPSERIASELARSIYLVGS